MLQQDRQQNHRALPHGVVLLLLSLPFLLVQGSWIEASKKKCHLQTTLRLQGGSSGAVLEGSNLAVDLPYTTAPLPASVSGSTPPPTTTKRRRRASDLIVEILDRASGLDSGPSNAPESLELRRLIVERLQEPLQALRDQQQLLLQKPRSILPGDDWDNTDPEDLPDPRRLLHYLAPKIPAIRHSPDSALQIQTARSDWDPGAAASLIGCLAHVSLLRDRVAQAMAASHGVRLQRNEEDRGSASPLPQMVQERRFEQLVECVLGGLDIPRLLRQGSAPPPALNRAALVGDNSKISAALVEDFLAEDTLDAHVPDKVEGLSVRDTARAAWGLAILGAHRLEKLGGQSVSDILVALSLHARERLLSRLQVLRKADLSSQTANVDARIAELSEALAEDAAAAVWAFACVRACTGLRFAPLLEVCCAVLCQNPRELRRQAQEAEKDPGAFSVGSSDVVDRLALAEGGTGLQGADLDGLSGADITVDESLNRDAMVDALSPNEVTDVLWALALHGSRAHAESPSEEIALSETASAVQEILCDRLAGWLRVELDAIWTRKAVKPSFRAPENESALHAVDAATILRSEVASYESQSHEGGWLDDQRMISDEDLLSGENRKTTAINVDSVELAVGADMGVMRSIPGSASNLQTFQPRDLCSMVWAATELQDDLQSTITKLVVSIFVELGADSFHELEGKDLSNLAWAIAKIPSRAGIGGETDESVEVMAWIANAVVSPDVNVSSLACHLQPPELGRLIWAVATSSLSSNSSTNLEGMQRLALAALQATVDGFSGFGAEDLARVAWGFVVLSDTRTVLDRPTIAQGLGNILGAVKASLVDWEKGTFPVKPEGGSPFKNLFSFSTFFGRARFLAHLLDQQSDDVSEDYENFGISLLAKKPHLPLLRDLPLDPSTLCKITSVFVKLRHDSPFITGGDVFSRVALRLMTSRSGRLLRECPISDIVRLCEAVASDNHQLGRERVSLFARKIVQLFNSDSTNGGMFDLLSQERALFLWALGELGVKFSSGGVNDAATAHRRLQLIGAPPIWSDAEIQSLTTSGAIKLFSGFVKTHAAGLSPSQAVTIMTVLSDRVVEVDAFQLVSLAEDVSRLKRLVLDETVHTRSTNQTTADANVTAVNTTSSSTSELQDDTASKINETDHVSNYTMMASACDRLLSLLAQRASGMVSTMPAEVLRRLISVFSLLPFRADELVAAVSQEVESRLDALALRESSEWSIETRIHSLAMQAEVLLKELCGGDQSTLGSAIRSGVSFLFGGDRKETDPEILAADNSRPEEAEHIKNVLASLVEVSRRMSELSSHSCLNLNDFSRYTAQSTALDLGRCQELVSHYSRIDFDAGRRRDRHELDDKRALAKQVLSRLLP